MINIPLPRLLNASGGTERTIRPIAVSANLNITPLSYASMRLPRGENIPARGYVELYTSMGSIGIYRVQSPQEAYGDDITTVDLEHAIVEVGDYLVLKEYDEMMAANAAMTTVFSHYRGTRWKLGSVSALGTGKIALQTDHDRVLGAMLSILDQKPDCMMSFDFSTTPWTVNIVSRGTTVSAEGRLSRNVNSAKVVYDDAALCTRVYYEVAYAGEGEEEPYTEWYHKDADTLSKYGIVEKTISTINYTKDEADWMASEYLSRNKEPRISVEISAEELSSITGEPFDTFTIGKLYRIALPDYGTNVEQVITGLSWDNVYDEPFAITVYLAEEEDTAITFLHDLDTKGGATTSGGGGSGKKQDDKWKEYWTKFDQTDYYFDLMAVRVDRDDNILQQAGLYIDANGVLQYAQDNENMIGSQFKVAADEISAVSAKTNENGDRISFAEVRINGVESKITLQAGRTDELEGRISSAEIEINGAEGYVGIKARVNNAESSLKVASDQITAVTTQADKNGQILKAAGMSITSNGVIQYATDVKNGIASMIQTQADRISLVVTGSGTNAKINPASIVASINADKTSEIIISADHLDLRGLVTASELQAQKARIDSIFSGFTAAGTIIVGSKTMLSDGGVSTDEAVIRNKMTYGGYSVTWKTATVLTGAEVRRSTSGPLYAAPSSGAPATVQFYYTSGVWLDTTETTINYLGR